MIGQKWILAFNSGFNSLSLISTKLIQKVQSESSWLLSYLAKRTGKCPASSRQQERMSCKDSPGPNPAVEAGDAVLSVHDCCMSKSWCLTNWTESDTWKVHVHLRCLGPCHSKEAMKPLSDEPDRPNGHHYTSISMYCVTIAKPFTVHDSSRIRVVHWRICRHGAGRQANGTILSTATNFTKWNKAFKSW